mgnify:CR=1 FL=1
MVRRYQGALVQVFRRGVFLSDGRLQVQHVDVRSMYPTIMIVFNLSPENVQLVDRRAYTGNYRFGAELLEVPDSYHGQLVLRVGQQDSVTRRFLVDLYRLRLRLKAAAKKGDVLAESREKAVKLLMNQIYGYHGLEFSRYGSFLVAIATTAIGRYIMNLILDVARENGALPLECDTDGIYVYGAAGLADKVNERLQRVFGGFKFSDWLRVESKVYDGIIVFKCKNYILRDGDRLIVKGSGFKGRHFPPVCDYAVKRFAWAVFRGENFADVWGEFRDLRRFPLKMFTMNVSLRKADYEDSTLYARLMERLPPSFKGEEVYFVKCVDGYFPLGVRSDDELRRMLDVEYYRERIREVVNRVLEPVRESQQKSLWRWM